MKHEIRVEVRHAETRPSTTVPSLFKRMWPAFFAVTCLMFVAGCNDIYNSVAQNGGRSVFGDTRDMSVQGSYGATAPPSDVKGEIGHKFGVGYYIGMCRKGGGNGDIYNSDYDGTMQITSGQLPPGLELSGNSITGIPTQRGHWIIGVHQTGWSCFGSSYGLPDTTVAIHISGSGEVVQ